MLEIENFLVAETVDTTVVYKTTCLEDVYKADDGTQTFFEISKTPVALRGASGPGGLDAMTIVDGSLDIINGGLAIGMIVAPPPANVVCGVLAGLGALIQAGLKFFDHKPDPVKEKMKELLKQLDQLEEKTKALFDDFKSFITEHKFAVEIISQMSTLKRYMHDVLNDRTPESIAAFESVYRMNTPLNLAYILMSLMDQRSTNPLIMAMASEKTKTATTFKKWEKIIRVILGDLLFIEAVASGLLKNQSLHDCEKLSEQSYELYNTIAEWEKEYKKDQTYWEEVNRELCNWIRNASALDNQKKAEALEKQMATYLTNDRFYIFVFNHCEWEKDYTYRCSNENEQIAGCWGVGGCNAFIYRSRNSHQKSEEDYKSLSEKVIACRNGKLQYSNKWKKHEKIWLTERHLYNDYGFVCLIYYDQNLHFRHIDQNREPGRYSECNMVQKDDGAEYKYWLHVAFD